MEIVQANDERFNIMIITTTTEKTTRTKIEKKRNDRQTNIHTLRERASNSFCFLKLRNKNCMLFIIRVMCNKIYYCPGHHKIEPSDYG